MPDTPAIIYLDVEDEITSAASRIRAAESRRLAVVIPPGSRIATSRMNFRLLAREALAGGRRLAIVAPDAPSRALAASAGLPVFGSVGEFESASSAPPTPDGDGAAGGSVDEAPAAPSGGARRRRNRSTATATLPDRAEEGTIIIPPVPTEGAAWSTSGPPAAATASELAPAARSATPAVAARGVRRWRVPRLLPVAIGLVLVALLVGGVAGYVLLPSATVVVTPRYEPVGPISFTVRADPTATGVDGDAGIIPAQRLTFDLSETGTFEATGKREEKKAASGIVRWTNCDPTASYRIPSGAIVRTERGIRFATTEAVFLPVAGIRNGNVLDCQSSTAGVAAVDPGPEGNVDAGAITVPPSNYNANVIHVTNPDPTTGGSLKTFPRVKQADVDAAQAALRKQLAKDLDAKLAAPDAVPSAMTAFPATKSLSEPTPDGDPSALVGQEIETFDLTMSATGSVVAVDERPIETIGAARLAGSVRANRTLVADSVTITTGKASVSGEVVTFPVDASATQVAHLDAAALRDAIRGRPLDEARRTLEAYGDASITTWPDWVSSIPTIDQRLDVEVAPPPSPSPAPSPVHASPRPSRSGPSPAPSGS
ncbi:MAG TPA: baseplate J/gp47 family protein [Candidatus Limnocylindrales bacterium]|nr:baseplate J/gp47 family protein [Candidatus Limnocylindrales bacterium]